MLLIYGSTSFGMNLYFHFCCDETPMEQAMPKHACCKKPVQQPKNDNCCNGKVVDFKINGEYDNAKVINFSAFQFTCLKPVATHHFKVFAVNSEKPSRDYFTPPPLQKDRNQLFCVYLI